MGKIMYYCEKCGEMYPEYDNGLSVLLRNCKKCGGIVRKTVSGILDKTPLSEEQYLYLTNNNKFNNDIKRKHCPMLQQSTQSQPIPKCPTCGSTNIRRMSATEKVVNVGMFGLFGNKRKYQFECLNPNCKYKW